MDLLTLILLFVLVILYANVPVSKYCIKYVVYFSVVMIASLIVIPAAMVRPKNCKNTRIVSLFLGPLLNKLLGLRWHIENGEILEKDRAAVILANHQSGLDFLGMLNLWPIMGKCSAVAKSELRFVGPFGLAAWLCGTLYINRSKSGNAKATMNENIGKVKKDKIKCWIFPEGTRSDSGILPFKKGAFHLAIEGNLPIIPIVTSNYYFLDHKKRIFDSGDVLIKVLEPISTEGMTKADIPKLVDVVRNKMIEEYEKLTKEVNQKAVAATY
ncbi:1-acyl-sn-glycerol-3-phosphate acyltransferase alpha-like [Artemia franciscana]|uniref:1-acylglycerol-3-phosphate O-acyltransferase n=1 Tax=Artemia franciscana TaxID=6661 RepID=A0AA88LI50_ARTSF|nr:hypothetical protein QYM36_008439 [Artemia franciscana]